MSKTACSIIKNIAGNSWFSLIKGFSITKENCPLPAVKYKTLKIIL